MHMPRHRPSGERSKDTRSRRNPRREPIAVETRPPVISGARSARSDRLGPEYTPSPRSIHDGRFSPGRAAASSTHPGPLAGRSLVGRPAPGSSRRCRTSSSHATTSTSRSQRSIPAGLHQQRHVEHHDRAAGRRCRPPGSPPAGPRSAVRTRGMDDRLEILERGLVGRRGPEDQPGQQPAAAPALPASSTSAPNRVDDLRHRRGLGQHLVGEPIGIEHLGPAVARTPGPPSTSRPRSCRPAR